MKVSNHGDIMVSIQRLTPLGPILHVQPHHTVEVVLGDQIAAEDWHVMTTSR